MLARPEFGRHRRAVRERSWSCQKFRHPSSSSTACGCTPPAGGRGWTCSARPATSRSLRAGRTSPHRRRGTRASRAGGQHRHRRGCTTTSPTIIEQLGAPPVIVGHSFGGLIAEKLLGQGVGAAAVAIDPAQIKGVLPLPLAQLRAGLPALGNPANLHKCGLADAEGVPVRLRQRTDRGGVRRAVRAVDDPVAGTTAVPGCGGQLRPALAGQGRHRQRDPRAAAADLRPRGPHGAGRRHPIDPQAVPRLRRRSPSSSSSKAAATRSRSTAAGGTWPTPSSTGSKEQGL